MNDIETVTIIGANSVMGSKVAAIFASFGDAKVYMVSRDKEKSINAIKSSIKSVRSDAIGCNLIAKDYNDLKDCLIESDLIFESVAEDYEIKKSILELINNYAKKDAIIATGTSGISINKMANILDDNLKKNYIGLHFFNPPYNMMLCEIIPSKYNTKKFINTIELYLQNILHRKTVIVQDSPAFLANKIGFLMINYSLQQAEKYKNKGGIDYIDSICGCFTGRNMPPIETADFVGLDIHKAIVDNVYNNCNSNLQKYFMLPNYVDKLIKNNKLGNKTGIGLFKKEDSEKKIFDIAKDSYRNANKYDYSFINEIINGLKIGNYNIISDVLSNDSSEEAKICKEFLLLYATSSYIISNEVSSGIHDADIAMIYGFNWAPPSSIFQLFTLDEINKYMKKEFNEIINTNVLCNIDYRSFFKGRV